MRPRKSLGQNFLINQNAAIRIVSLLELKPGEQIVEIGGGRGDLTGHLVETGAEVITVEFDKSLVSHLSERFRDRLNFRLIADDILKVDPLLLLPKAASCKLVGNIPYNLTSPIIEWTIKHRSVFPQVVFMVQREVAQRIAAKPGKKDFGSLTVFVQLFYEVNKVFDLKPGSFYPPPKVNSSVIRLNRHPRSLIRDDEYPTLRRLTSACFRWRRKQIVRILREEYQMEPDAVEMLLNSLDIDHTSRPEQLSVSTFVSLMRKLECASPDSQ